MTRDAHFMWSSSCPELVCLLMIFSLLECKCFEFACLTRNCRISFATLIFIIIHMHLHKSDRLAIIKRSILSLKYFCFGRWPLLQFFGGILSPQSTLLTCTFYLCIIFIYFVHSLLPPRQFTFLLNLSVELFY